jgi:hypoxanthine phosphoribosyltransferase
MSVPALDEILRVQQQADLLFSPAEINAAVVAMAESITARIGTAHPLLLATMTGGLVPTALLLPHLHFPLQLDYLHVTRYGTAITGGQIEWVKRPPEAVRGRTVLIIDDLLDRGLTLQEAAAECARLGARETLTAVLVHKEMATRPGLARTDFCALATPDRYLFGYGMDYKTYWRNGPGIYAVRGT